MKNLKSMIAMVIFVVFATVFLSVGLAAAKGCYGDIAYVGMEPGIGSDPNTNIDDFVVVIRCGDWTDPRPFVLSSDLGAEGYATFLTAFTLNRPVKVQVEDYASYSLLTEVRVYPGD